MKTLRKIVWWACFWTAVFTALWLAWIYQQVYAAARQDFAAPADAIAVFGAAEYNGRPSPVLRARLDHALDLYREGYAPLLITLGGGSDPRWSEGEVERDYLLSNGVPDARIIAETESQNTEQSVQHLAEIVRANHLRSVIAVSDGTHLFRIRQLCHAQGLHVLTSPRPAGKPMPVLDVARRYAHEVVSYALWSLHLH